MADLKVQLQAVMDALANEGVTEISTGNLAHRISRMIPGRSIQSAFHMIHRFGHSMTGWRMLRNHKRIEVLRRCTS